MSDEHPYTFSVSANFSIDAVGKVNYPVVASEPIPTDAYDITPVAPATDQNPLGPWLALPGLERQKSAKPVLTAMFRTASEAIMHDLQALEMERAARRIAILNWCAGRVITEYPSIELTSVPGIEAFASCCETYNRTLPRWLDEIERERLAEEAAAKLNALRRQREAVFRASVQSGPSIIALPNSFPESWEAAWSEGRIMGLGNAQRYAPYRVGRYEWLEAGLQGVLIGMWPERIGTLNPSLVIDKGQAHLTTIMPTRQGKSACHVIPNVLAYQGSCVVVDTKGAIFEATADALRAKGKRVFRLRPFEPHSPDQYNPFHHIGIHEGFEERARAFVETLLEREGLSGDGKFWQQKGAAAIFAMLLFVAQSPEPSTCNMRGLKTYADNPKGLLDTAEQLASRVRQGNHIATWAQRILADADSWEKLAAIAGQEVTSILEPWFSETVLAATSSTTIEPRELMASRSEEGQFVLFIDLPSNRAEYYKPVIRGLLGTLFDAIKFAPQDKTQLPVLFLLDEFANYGYVKTFATALREAAGYGIRIWTFLQGRQDLQRTYPNEWKSFVDNATVIYGASGDHELASEMKEFFGQRTYQEKYWETDAEKVHSGEYREHLTLSTQAQRDQFGNPQVGVIAMQEAIMIDQPVQRERTHFQTEDVVPVRAVQSLPLPWQIVRPVGEMPILCAKLPVFDPIFQRGIRGE